MSPSTRNQPHPIAKGTTLLAHPATLSTPIYPYSSPGVFTVHSLTHIATASPLHCLRTTLDTSSYHNWNPFCPAITIDSHPSNSNAAVSTPADLFEAITAGTGPLGDGLVTVPEDEVAREYRQTEFLRVGTYFTETIFMDGSGLSVNGQPRQPPFVDAKGNRPTKLQISELSYDANGAGDGRALYRVVWKGAATGIMARLLMSERVHEFKDDGKGGCDYENWETFAGPVSYIVKWLFGRTLVERFDDWSVGLTRYLEAEGERKRNGVDDV